MSKSEEKVRIVLRLMKCKDGTYVMQKCLDQWKTLPFKWASEKSAVEDFMTVVQTFEAAGYEVIPPQKGEVKTE